MMFSIGDRDRAASVRAAALCAFVALVLPSIAQAGGTMQIGESPGTARGEKPLWSQPAASLAPGGGGSLVDPGILPPDSSPYGASYGEWSAAWWRWAISMPTASHPLFDNAGCDAGQSGPVWFLGGTFTGATVTRQCTVAAGMALFFPIVTAECSTVEPDPFHGNNEAELRACAQGWMDLVNVAELAATIDGVPVQNPGDYRVQSPLFDFSAPDDNVLFVPGPVSGQSVSDGFWLFLAPLSAGHHTIHIEFPMFLQNVTYELTVLPGGRGRGRNVRASGVATTTWGFVKEIYRD